jgi:hypothetical protein
MQIGHDFRIWLKWFDRYGLWVGSFDLTHSYPVHSCPLTNVLCFITSHKILQAAISHVYVNCWPNNNFVVARFDEKSLILLVQREMLLLEDFCILICNVVFMFSLSNLLIIASENLLFLFEQFVYFHWWIEIFNWFWFFFHPDEPRW